MQDLNIELINQAAEALSSLVRKTPLEYSPVLSDLYDMPVYLKMEFLQITGSFKLRGAFFRLLRLRAEEKSKGVATCSAGNHGWALAYAGRQLDIPVTVYLPNSVDPSKKAGIESQGAKTIVADSAGYDGAEEFALRDSTLRRLPFVSAFNEPEIMAANGGSLALEILEELPATESFVYPVGGGGLAAGLGVLVKSRNPEATLIGCQHIDSPGLKLSLEKGNAVTRLPAIDTIAGGIEGGIGANTFPYIRDTIDKVILLSEEEIRRSVVWMLEHHRCLIEPSSAAALAALIFRKVKKLNGPTVVILTGRNIALETLRRIIGC